MVHAISELSVAGKTEWQTLLRILILEKFSKDSFVYFRILTISTCVEKVNITINFFPTENSGGNSYQSIRQSIRDMESGDENMCTFAEKVSQRNIELSKTAHFS